MQLANVKPTAPFVSVSQVFDKIGTPPPLVDVPYGKEPAVKGSLVSVRYRGRDTHGTPHQLTVSDTPGGAPGCYWMQVKGSFDDAVRAARAFAIEEGDVEDPAAVTFARSSVAILAHGVGRWDLQRMMFTDGMDDGMDPIISMPIEDRVRASKSQVSVPYGDNGGWGFDKPDTVTVRFNDPRVKALVGVDAIALPKGLR
jgi:hypothetical protein